MALTGFFDVRRLANKMECAGEIPGNREMYSTYLRLAIPSVLEMVLISLINMMDTVMVSSIGTDAVAAVGLVGQPRLIMLCAFFALNTGITAVIARRRGEERQKDAGAVMRTSILIMLGMSAVLMAIMLPLARPLMRFAGAEEGRTLEDATAYFTILVLALPFNALSMGICAAQRGCGNTKLTMYVNIASNLVNILFNWLLINGIGPFPRLEVKGAAIASAIGLFVGFVLSLLSLFKGGDKAFLHLSLKDDWRFSTVAARDLTRVASSAMVEQLCMRIGFFAYAKIVAGLGTDAFAAHQICMQFLNLSFSFADGFGIAGTSLVGQMLGRKRQDLAHLYGILAQRFALSVAVMLGLFCILGRNLLVSMFISQNANAGVKELAAYVMMVVGVIQPFQMLAVVISGALRGAGDVKYTAKVMLLTVSVMRPILALSAVYIVGTLLKRSDLALIGCWCAALIDMALRMVLMNRRYKSGKWHGIRV